MEGSADSLAAFARRLLTEARAEAEEGYAAHDAIKVRKAAERAWRAACAATDAAMAARGLPRDGSGADRARHYAFLDSIESGAYSLSYASFAERLHQLCACDGHVPSRASWGNQLAAVAAFVEALTASL